MGWLWDRFYRRDTEGTDDQAYLHQLRMHPNDRSSVRADAPVAADPPYADLEAWEREAEMPDLDAHFQAQWMEMCEKNQFRRVKDQMITEGMFFVKNNRSLEDTRNDPWWVWKIVQYAAYYNAVWFIKFIHDYDPDLFKRGSERGLQVSSHGFQLHMMEGLFCHACMTTGNVEMVEYLLKEGCDPNEPSDEGTPLFLAAKTGDLHMMEALLRAGATSNPDAELHGLYHDQSLLSVVVRRKPMEASEGVRYRAEDTHEDIMERIHFVLTLSGPWAVDINQQDQDGLTALHVAAWVNNADAVQLLLDNGASMMIRSKKGRTALDENIRKRKCDVINIRIKFKSPTWDAVVPTPDGRKEFTKVMKMLYCGYTAEKEVMDMLDKVMDPPKDVIDSSAEHILIDLKSRVTDGVPAARERVRIIMEKDAAEARDILDNYERYAQEDTAERERYNKDLIPYPKLRLCGMSMTDVLAMKEECRAKRQVEENQTDEEFIHNDVVRVRTSWHSGSVSFNQIARLAGDICILIRKHESIPWCEGSDRMCLAVWLYDNPTIFWTPEDEVDMWVQLQHIYDAFMQNDIQKHIQERYERLDDPRRTLPNIVFLTREMWETAELKKAADEERKKKVKAENDAHLKERRAERDARLKERDAKMEEYGLTGADNDTLEKNWRDAYNMTRLMAKKYGWSAAIVEYRERESQALAAWRWFNGRPRAIPRPNDWTMPVVDDYYEPGDYRLYFRSREEKAIHDERRYKAYLVWDKLFSRDAQNTTDAELRTILAEEAEALKTWDLLKDGTRRANEIREIPRGSGPERW